MGDHPGIGMWQGEVAVIPGTGSGVGKARARVFAREGWSARLA